MKKIVIALLIVIVVFGAIALCKNVYEGSKGTLQSDTSTGNAKFEKISYDTGFGVNIDEGEFPIEVNLTSGTLNIKISKGDSVVFEETNIESSKTVTANIPETAYYIVTISGKKATGTLDFPVSESSNEPDLTNILPEENAEDQVKQEEVKQALMMHYADSYGDTVQELKFNKVNIYSEEQKKSDELIKSLNVGENDIVFEVEYELKIKEGYKDIMMFTAGTGEIDGQWVKEKYNCGVLRMQEDGTYKLTDFGTGF